MRRPGSMGCCFFGSCCGLRGLLRRGNGFALQHAEPLACDHPGVALGGVRHVQLDGGGIIGHGERLLSELFVGLPAAHVVRPVS